MEILLFCGLRENSIVPHFRPKLAHRKIAELLEADSSVKAQHMFKGLRRE
jgi:hypothetical protein